MKIKSTSLLIAGALFGAAVMPVHASNDAMLDLLKVLRDRGTITAEDYNLLAATQQQVESDADILKNTTAATAADVNEIVERKVNEAIDLKLDESFDARVEKTVTAQVEKKVDEFPVKVSHGSKGFRFETRDGNWQTNLQWRGQMRFTTPDRSDPRQLGNFDDNRQNTFENRRLRMKIGGHAYRPWLGYYFELDLQPTRDIDDDGASASTRVIDWRVTLDKYKAVALRLGQWKIDYNRERVDSSGRQQFVERSIVNRIFTVDRQVGAQLRGHLFEGTPADMRYYAGVFTGEGRGVRNDDEDLMYMGRLQWNLFGRDLAWKQTDVEYTEKPTGSLSLAAASNTGRCTRWSSSGCGNLDGYSRGENAEYEIEQWTQGSAFKWKGFSWQQEFHRKKVDDITNNTSDDLTGAYAQAGYFFHHLIPAIPKELELAARIAYVEEPFRNATKDLTLGDNEREEFTLAANWFINGHNNKITADYSYLTLDNEFVNRDVSESRVRLQWDVSF